jgi:uncharacterized protein YjbI with pentapeptide repeats
MAPYMRSALTITLLAIASLAAYSLLWRLPETQLRGATSLTEFQREQLILEARKTNAQIVGGVALLLGFYFTWRNLRATEEGKITERFTQAVNQLGSDKIEQRVGGILALNRLAIDSKKDHAPVIELICTFLRHRERKQDEGEPYKLPVGIPDDQITNLARSMQKTTGWAPSAPEDVKAAAIVIQRNRLKIKKPHTIDLSGADLRRVNLEGAILQKANLSHIYGEYLNLDGASLRGVNLSFSDLKMASLDKADLRGAWIGGTNFRWTELRKADLRGVKLIHQPEYDFGFESDPEIDHLIDEEISVDFEFADLRDALLKGVYLVRANLRSANLSTAIGLSYCQIENAYGNLKTQLPPNVARPPAWAIDNGKD